MKLSRVHVRNFRLLRDVELCLEDITTLVVGRNNSGKTSLSEVIRRFTTRDNPTFQLQDFSSECHEEFCAAFNAYIGAQAPDVIRGLLPAIELRLTFKYNPLAIPPQLESFIVDLDENCDEAVVSLRYEPIDGGIPGLFDGFAADAITTNRKKFFREFLERVPKHYTTNVWALYPSDPNNIRANTHTAVKQLLRTGFVNAQRGLDDITTNESDVLAKMLEGLFSTATLTTADKRERDIAAQLEVAVSTVQTAIDGQFRDQLQLLLPKLSKFGYPGLGGAELTTETILNVKRLLSSHTKIYYEGHTGVLLPETYNGLGMRNLIFILLQIVSFYREYRASTPAPGVHLVFIEEPEAHLHPQMQEVFIRQVKVLVDTLNKDNEGEKGWSCQFVISTHSSHIANEATFEAIRYFLPCAGNQAGTLWHTKVKDLRKGLSAVPAQDKEFLHKYLTLTRCDLFFADKAILIEGPTERLLLPIMMEKADQRAAQGPSLRAQYVTSIEVGGAYAHLFFPLLEFLELRTLIITDLDPVVKPGGAKCHFHESSASSNACINKWFGGGKPPSQLIASTEAELIKDDRVRLAFQIPEDTNSACGTTFEDAFLLANIQKFAVVGATAEEQAKSAKSKAADFGKTEFALKHALLDTNWNAPKYILDGLTWLAGGPLRRFEVPVGAIPANDVAGPQEPAATAQQVL